jgi:predicted DNA binding CopG/RHH family protein
MTKSKPSRTPQRRKPLYTEIKTPKFANEQEEADWWDSHPEAITGAIERAEAAGAVSEYRARPTRPTNIRLYVEDLEAAQKIAHRKGLKVQTYIKMVLHEAVRREIKAS